ncbi:MAG: hypothetical protein KDE01_09090, partial [Caldilineaceae bacterium]|nr:hypothetical protein [Caldilineaceae bacterium]
VNPHVRRPRQGAPALPLVKKYVAPWHGMLYERCAPVSKPISENAGHARSILRVPCAPFHFLTAA